MKFERNIISFLVLFSFIAGFPVSGSAQIFWATNGAPVYAGADEQMESAVTSDGSGGAIVAWMDERNGNWDIYAQRLDEDGNPRWTANGVPVCTTGDIQGGPRIVGDGSGGAIITWMDWRNPTWDIYAQRLDSNGNALWTANGVSVCTAGDDQEGPQLVSDGSGGAVITWQDWRNPTWDIYAQRLDADGTALWTANGEPVCTAGDAQEAPQLVSDGSGGAIITWEDWRNPTWDIYAQRMDANGNALWTADGVVVSNGANDQDEPAIVSNGAGGAIIIWEDDRNDPDDIYAQEMDSNGNALWTANGVVVCGHAAIQEDPRIASDGSGGAIIVWEDERNGIEDIYAQRMDGNGNPLWTANGIAVAYGADTQEDPVIISDGSGGAFIAWEQEIGGVDDLYVQRISGGGALYWPTDGIGVPVCVDNYETDDQELALLGTGLAVVTWTDNRGADQDIYAQKIGVETPAAVPTLNQWGMIFFVLILMAVVWVKQKKGGRFLVGSL